MSHQNNPKEFDFVSIWLYISNHITLNYLHTACQRAQTYENLKILQISFRLCCCCFNQCARNREMKRLKCSSPLDSPLNFHLYFHMCYMFKVLYNSWLLVCSHVAYHLNLTTRRVKVLKYQVVSNVKDSKIQKSIWK